jgi:hypothetical protein
VTAVGGTPVVLVAMAEPLVMVEPVVMLESVVMAKLLVYALVLSPLVVTPMMRDPLA